MSAPSTSVQLNELGEPHIVRFSASFIGNMRMCPERARISALKRFNGEAEVKTDSMMLGVTVHEVAEHFAINGNAEQATAYGRLKFDEAIEVGMEFNRTSNAKAATEVLGLLVDDMFYAMTQLEIDWDTATIEEKFIFDYRGMTFSGIPDIFDKNRVWDWKTGKYDSRTQWQVQRFDAAASLYCFHHGLQVMSHVYLGGLKSESRFTQVDVFRKNAQGFMDLLVDEIESWRYATDDFNLAIAWPLRTSDWWCAPTWCDNYHDCVGKTLTWEERSLK